MQILIVDISPPLRAMLLGRVQEAARQAGLQRISIVEVDPLNLDSVVWDATIGCLFGSGCGPLIREVLEKVSVLKPGCPVGIVVDPDTYVTDGVAIYKALGKAVMCETDLPQLATFIVDSERGASHRRKGAQRRCVIGVTQCKGGVGATTVATSLGVSLARSGKSVVLIDLDDLSPQLTMWARVPVTHRVAVGRLIRSGGLDVGALRDFIFPVPGFDSRLVVVGQPALYGEGFHLRAPVIEGAPNPADFISQLLTVLSQEYEVVLIDMSKSWGISSFAALRWCDRVLSVMNDDGLAVHMTCAVLKRMSSESGDLEEFNFSKWSGVLNMQSGNRLTESDVVQAFQEYEIVGEPLRCHAISHCDGGRLWGKQGESLYDLATPRVRTQVERLAGWLLDVSGVDGTPVAWKQESSKGWFPFKMR
jgi:cellulose biosynthesis protein BcsQ